jgi:hypothetical protein
LTTFRGGSIRTTCLARDGVGFYMLFGPVT